MHKGGKKVTFLSAVAIGIGAMVGAGIFALLGEAGTIAGNATWISFLLSGIIALLSGYSFGRLGACFPSAGGIVEYLTQSYGNGLFTGAMSVMMYIAATVSIALVGKAFGSYAWSMLPTGTPEYWKSVLGAAVILLFVLVNMNGAKSMGRLEIIIVGIKLGALCLFAGVGVAYISPERLSIANFPPSGNIFYALAITFFAYEGFRVVTNAAEDMDDVKRTLPRAIIAAILITMGLYVLIAIVMFGNLPVQTIVEAKDYALAEAARPVMGSAGFKVVAITALIATASAINASLYAVTNITYQLAKNGQLPKAFGRPIAHSREGLLISGGIIMLLTIFLNLNEIAVIGSLTILIVHFITHVGHLKVIKKTKASFVFVLLACITNLAAITLTMIYESKHSPNIVTAIVLCLLGSFLVEIILQMVLGKSILPRIKHRELHGGTQVAKGADSEK